MLQIGTALAVSPACRRRLPSTALLMERRCVGQADHSAFWGYQASDGLAPRFLSRVVQELIALRSQFVGTGSHRIDIHHFELKTCLWHGDIFGPRRRTEASLCGLL